MKLFKGFFKGNIFSNEEFPQRSENEAIYSRKCGAGREERESCLEKNFKRMYNLQLKCTIKKNLIHDKKNKKSCQENVFKFVTPLYFSGKIPKYTIQEVKKPLLGVVWFIEFSVPWKSCWRSQETPIKMYYIIKKMKDSNPCY